MSTAVVDRKLLASYEENPALQLAALERGYNEVYNPDSLTVPRRDLSVEEIMASLNRTREGFEEYVESRLNALAKILQQEGKLYGPPLRVSAQDINASLPFLKHFIWPFINFDYKGGLVLNWASSVASVSLKLPAGGSWSYRVTKFGKPLPDNRVGKLEDLGVITDHGKLFETLFLELVEISIRSIVAAPDWKAVMKSQIDM